MSTKRKPPTTVLDELLVEKPASEAPAPVPSLADALEQFDRAYESYRFTLMTDHLGQRTMKPKRDVGPVPVEVRLMIEAVTAVVLDPQNIETHHQVPASHLLMAWAAEFESELPRRTLTALKELREARPHEWMPLESLEEAIKQFKGQPNNIESFSRFLKVDPVTAQRLLSGELRKLPAGYVRPEIIERKRIIAEWREQYEQAVIYWNAFAAQRAAAPEQQRAAAEAHAASLIDPCPESWGELLMLDGMSNQQLARMKNCDLAEVERQRLLFEKESRIGHARQAVQEAQHILAQEEELAANE